MTPLQSHIFRKKESMTVEAEILLEIIFDEKEVTVSKLMDLAKSYKVCSHGSLHKNIMLIKDKSLISMTESLKDGRIKNCKLTRKGEEYYEMVCRSKT